MTWVKTWRFLIAALRGRRAGREHGIAVRP
jgi:hypothetical protein